MTQAEGNKTNHYYTVNSLCSWLFKYENQNEVNIVYVDDEVVSWRCIQFLEIEKMSLHFKKSSIYQMTLLQYLCHRLSADEIICMLKFITQLLNLDSRFCWWRLAYDALSGDVRIVLCHFSSSLEQWRKVCCYEASRSFGTCSSATTKEWMWICAYDWTCLSWPKLAVN